MSDLEVRRLTRELLRTGMDAEQVLQSVLVELSEVRGPWVVFGNSLSRGYISAPGLLEPAAAGAPMVLHSLHWQIEMRYVPRIVVSGPHDPSRDPPGTHVISAPIYEAPTQ